MYGVRLRMLHERTAMNADAEKFDPIAFCWTGGTGTERSHVTIHDGDSPVDHVTNVLASQISREGRFDLESLMKTVKEWMPDAEGIPDGNPI